MLRETIINFFVKYDGEIVHDEKNYTVIKCNVKYVFITLSDTGIEIYLNNLIEVYDTEMFLGGTKINDISKIEYMEVIH